MSKICETRTLPSQGFTTGFHGVLASLPEAAPVATLRAELARFAPANQAAFSDEEWNKVLVFADKTHAGEILHRRFLLWAVGDGSAQSQQAAVRASSPRGAPNQLLYTSAMVGGVSVGYLMTIVREKISSRNLAAGEVFKRFDSQSCGELQKTDFIAFLKSMSLGLTQQELEQLFEFTDTDRDGKIS